MPLTLTIYFAEEEEREVKGDYGRIGAEEKGNLEKVHILFQSDCTLYQIHHIHRTYHIHVLELHDL